MIGRALLRGLQPSASLVELKCIDKGETVPQWTAQSSSLPADQVHRRLTYPPFGATDVAAEPIRALEDGEMAAHQSRWWNNLPDFRMHQIFREAVELCAAVDELRAEPGRVEDLLRTMASVAELVQQIENWKADVSDVFPEHVDSVKHFNGVWRQGMLCYVYHDIYPLESSDERIQACVQASLEPLSSSSWLQAALFPIFMTAVHAQTAKARECFQVAFTNMHQPLAFQTPLSLALVLKNIWAQLDENMTGGLRWREIVHDMGMELNLLLEM